MNIPENRQRWIQALKENGSEQCMGWNFNSFHSKVCALQLILTLTPLISWKKPIKGGGALPTPPYREIEEWLGIGENKLSFIFDNNDKGWTFAEIADAAEAEAYWNLEDNVVPLARAA